MLKRMMRNLIAGGSMALLAVSGLSLAIPALAATTQGFTLKISGTSGANTGYVTKDVSNQDGTVYISGTTAGAANMWAEMYNSNGISRSDAVLATYQGRTPLTNNTGLAGYAYYLNAHRQYYFDSPQTFQGWWSPDQA